MHVRIHTHTSGAVLTAQQPLVNLIRRDAAHARRGAGGHAGDGGLGLRRGAGDPHRGGGDDRAAHPAGHPGGDQLTAVTDPLAGSYSSSR